MSAEQLAIPTVAVPVPAPAPAPGKDANEFTWTAGTICLSIALFLFAALAEVGGGWLVWQTIRENKAWWMAVLGALVLVGYGFIPTLQPTDSFGRIYGTWWRALTACVPHPHSCVWRLLRCV